VAAVWLACCLYFDFYFILFRYASHFIKVKIYNRQQPTGSGGVCNPAVPSPLLHAALKRLSLLRDSSSTISLLQAEKACKAKNKNSIRVAHSIFIFCFPFVLTLKTLLQVHWNSYGKALEEFLNYYLQI